MKIKKKAWKNACVSVVYSFIFQYEKYMKQNIKIKYVTPKAWIPCKFILPFHKLMINHLLKRSLNFYKVSRFRC